MKIFQVAIRNAALVACSLVTSQVLAVTQLDKNLIVNPGAEGSVGASDFISAQAPAGWQVTSNFTALKYNISPSNQVSGANVAILGTNFFAGGPDNNLSSARQTIDVSDRAAEIDAGSLYAVLEGLFGGTGNSSDFMEMRAEFLSASQTVIATKVVPSVDVLDRPGATFNLVPRSTSRLVPAGTRAVRIVLESNRIDAETYNDGYADNVSFRLVKDASTVVVPGSANPYLANAAPGTSAQGDSAPGVVPQTLIPAQVSGLVTLPNAQETFYFFATGGTEFNGNAPTTGPDGSAQFWTEGAARGISGAVYPLNALVGVFLDERTLQPNDTPPAALDFSPNGNVPGGVNYTDLSPAIGQLFFIGDGFTSNGVGQKVKAPMGATRLYLGSTDGSGWYNNSGAFTVQVSKKPITPGPALPPHGGLSETSFTVNDSTTPASGLADTVLRFAAQQTSNAANLSVRVQYNTGDPNSEPGWTDLPDANDGKMTLDVTSNPKQFVLNSTAYPATSGVHFRAITAASGFNDSISNHVGSFDLTGGSPRVGPTLFTIFSNTEPANIPPGHEIHFGASRPPNPAGVSVKVQSSTKPHDASSWTDLPNGTMTPGASESFALDSKNYPSGDAVYFRAVSSLSGRVPDISNLIGPFHLVQSTPPTVTITPPSSNSNPTGNGKTLGQPIVIKAANGGLTTFNFSASASSARQIAKLELLVDGGVVDSTGAGASSLNTQFNTNVYGIHELRAIATDDLGSTADADPYYIIIHPTGGKILTFVADTGDWSTASNWVNLSNGQSAIPGANDLAIIGNSTVTLSGDVSVFALVVNGGTISGSHNLNVLGISTFAGGKLQDLTLNIDARGACIITGDTDLAMNGTLNNSGKLQMTGLGGITGITTAAAKNLRAAGGVTPDDFGSFLRGVVNNIGKSLFPKRGAPKKTTNVNGIDRQLPIVNARFNNAGRLITNDGGSLITNDGGSRPAPGTAADGSAAGYFQTAGETDLGTAGSLSHLDIVGDVTLEGGSLTGSGRIHGNLVNNGGFISPGHSAGRIEVGGNFTQGANGTLIIENGGAAPSQFDQLIIDGDAALGGHLHIKDINGFTPDAADAFNPLGFASATGAFSSVSSNAQVTVAATGISTTVNPSAAAPDYGQPLNISTRMRVLTGDNVLIGGFIVTGPTGSSKKVMIRGLGPSLAAAGLTGVLSDPLLELHKSDGSTVTNDNWADLPNKSEIPNGYAPQAKESVIVADLAPGNYTVIERGAHGETGVGLTEIYDLNDTAAAKLGNISTRGFVDTGDNVLIGGFIVGGSEPGIILVRAIGPSLKAAGLTGVLEDPILELHDANGSVFSNDDWREAQESEITATTIPPSNNLEPAILATLAPGNYTVVVRGKDGGTGIGLVEAYNVK